MLAEVRKTPIDTAERASVALNPQLLPENGAVSLVLLLLVVDNSVCSAKALTGPLILRTLGFSLS